MTKTLHIRGVGLITAAGSGAPANWDFLERGRYLTNRGVAPDGALAQAFRGAWVQFRDNSPLDEVPSSEAGRIVMLAGAALGEALFQAQLHPADISSPDTQLFVATSKGPVLSILQACETLRRQDRAGLPPVLPGDLAETVALGPAALGADLARLFGISTAVHTSVAACAGALFAVHRAVRALRTGECRRALVVAADASVHPLFEGSFQRLGVLAGPDADGQRRCRPFDPHGGGFFLSEAGAAIVLEVGLEAADAQGSAIELRGAWTGADGGNLLIPDVSAAALRRGLRACAADGPVSFVHAHAAGTAHDGVELAAIADVCGDVPVFSHKGALGHSLGAAGLVALVISALAHQYGRTPEDQKINPAANSVTLAQGFGGHIGMAVLRGPKTPAVEAIKKRGALIAGAGGAQRPPIKPRPLVASAQPQAQVNDRIFISDRPEGTRRLTQIETTAARNEITHVLGTRVDGTTHGPRIKFSPFRRRLPPN